MANDDMATSGVIRTNGYKGVLAYNKTAILLGRKAGILFFLLVIFVS